MTECKCSLRIRLLGDGCSVCNPEYYAEMLQEQYDSTRDYYRQELLEIREVVGGWDNYHDWAWNMIFDYFTHE